MDRPHGWTARGAVPSDLAAVLPDWLLSGPRHQHWRGVRPSGSWAARISHSRPSPRHISSLVTFNDCCTGIVVALLVEMQNPLPLLGLPSAAAAVALVLVLGLAVRRRYLSPLSDIPGPFWGSISRVWQLHQIFAQHTERATIDAHKKWGTS